MADRKRVGNPSRTANKPRPYTPRKKRSAEPPNRKSTAKSKAFKVSAKKRVADRQSANPPNRRKTAAKAVGNAPNQKKTTYIDMTARRKEKGTGSVKRSSGKPSYQPKKTTKSVDEVADYGRAIRYTKFGERNTTYGKTGTYQTTYGKGGSQTTRKIGTRTARDIRGAEGRKRGRR